MMEPKPCEGYNNAPAPEEPEELLRSQRIESGDLNDRSVDQSPLKIESRRAKQVKGFEQPESSNRGAPSTYRVNMGAKRSSSMTSTFAASSCAAADNYDSQREANLIGAAGEMSISSSQKTSPVPAAALSSGTSSSSSSSHDALSQSSFQASIKRSFNILSKIDLSSGNDCEPLGLLYHPGVGLNAKEWTKDEKDNLLKFVNKHIPRESGSKQDGDDCAA